MATPADQRVLELLDKWIGSLDLHLKYASLDDDHYWQVQPWIEHQRPSRWIIDLAKEKALALRTLVAARIEAGDEKFADALELTIFLANLVGSQHIERFIPLAEAESELAPSTADTSTGTREMPQYLAAKPRMPAAAGTAHVARAERKSSSAPPKPRLKQAAATASVTAPPAAAQAPAGSGRAQVLADAERLLQWGRKWYELPELIARMADRPPLPEVRRILKEHKTNADKKNNGK